MRRAWAALVTATLILILGGGCGKQSYEARLEATLLDMKYRQALDENLIAAPNDQRLRDFPMYIRPPKDMELASQFTMAEVPPGVYDLAVSFLSKSQGAGGRSLHVLGRRKTPKKTTKKGQAPEPAAARGPFDQDVLTLLAGVYGANEALQNPKYQTETKRKNKYRSLVLTTDNGRVVRVYFHGAKGGPYEAALIWDIPKEMDRDQALRKARDLMLQSFAVGNRARSSFVGNLREGEGGGEGGGGAAPF